MKVKLNNQVDEAVANENGLSKAWTYEVNEQVGEVVSITNCHGKDVSIPLPLLEVIEQ